MENKIQKIRIKLDGISQLVKQLGIGYIIRFDKLPEDLKTEDFVNSLKKIPLVQFIEQDEQPITEIRNYNIEKSYDSILLAREWLNTISEELGYEEQEDSSFGTDIQTRWNIEELNYYDKILFIITEIRTISEEILGLNSGKMVVQEWTSNRNNICDITKNQAFIEVNQAIFFLKLELLRVDNINAG